jgi:hypothetical protein
MKTHRIFGISWLVICSILFIKWLFWITVKVPSFRPPVDSLRLYIYLFFCLLYLAGIVASFQIIQGVQWARTFVGSIAMWCFIACIFQMLALRHISFFYGMSGAFYGVSFLFLLAPRRGKVA